MYFRIGKSFYYFLSLICFKNEICLKVKISLKRKASSIAVRFNPEKHKIQVVDNGIGFTKYELSNLFYNEEKNYVDQETIFDKINSSSNVVIVTSRSEYSLYTFVKVIYMVIKFIDFPEI